MAEFTPYITVENDRWDLIASIAYGDASDFKGIQSANPDVPITAILPAGIELNIPIKEDASSTTTNPNLLPPWKR